MKRIFKPSDLGSKIIAEFTISYLIQIALVWKNNAYYLVSVGYGEVMLGATKTNERILLSDIMLEIANEEDAIDMFQEHVREYLAD